MSATFYELMKYAKTGIASPSMTHYDMMKARAMFGGGFPVTTLTGVPPISFKSDGTPLTSYSISGNMVQSGTQTRSDPIYPQECGERTKNFLQLQATSDTVNGVRFDVSPEYGTVTLDGKATQNFSFQLFSMAGLPDGNYYLSGCPADGGSSRYTLYVAGASATTRVDSGSGVSFENSGGYENCRIYCYKDFVFDNLVFRPMIRASTASADFEPYGYKLSITCGGQTNPVYLQEPIRKIGDYADTVASDGTVTRRVKRLVLDGDEHKFLSKAAAGSFVLRLEDGKFHEIASLCSHFLYSTDNLNRPGYYFIPQSATYNQWNFWWDDSKTLTEANQWLADQYANGTPVCVWYVLATETTETFTAPTITPAKGANTLEIGTTLQPSSVSLTGGIK